MMRVAVLGSTGSIGASTLDVLARHRDQFTSFAGLSHPGVDGNHHAGQCFLSGAPHPGQPTFRNSLSLDQLVAEKVGEDTLLADIPHGASKQAAADFVDGTRNMKGGAVVPAAIDEVG